MICYQPWEIWGGLIMVVILCGALAFMIGYDSGVAAADKKQMKRPKQTG